MGLEIIGNEYLFDFGDNAKYQLKFIDEGHLDVTVVEDSFFAKGTLNHFTPEITKLAEHIFMITWTEAESNNTVVHVDDFEKNISYTNITNIPSEQFWRLKGTIKKVNE